jgi:hypothetical protein
MVFWYGTMGSKPLTIQDTESLQHSTRDDQDGNMHEMNNKCICDAQIAYFLGASSVGCSFNGDEST